MTLRIVFCGTPSFAVPSLRHLLDQPDFEVVAVVTQPDRASGRGHKVVPPPVKEVASERGVRVVQPERIGAAETEGMLRELAPEAVAIIAYGQIVPPGLLPLPRLGWINLHASLLPKYRGAAPIQWAIAGGEPKTGLTTMRIDAGLDTGEILLQQEMPIGADETAPELTARMADAGAPLLADTLRKIVSGEVTPRSQEHSRATYAPQLKREDGRVDWSQPATAIYNRMRGFAPWPGSYSAFRGQTCHIWGRPLVGTFSRPADVPGTIHVEEGTIGVACGGGSRLKLLFLQFEGRKQISAREFANGVHLRDGESFSNRSASKETG
ncbi:MAG: methionyl-tRNA formyltransferase [Candidatus Acidiferrales bacterium]|jgi:methionyl-tRNA formyltransferase